MAKFDPDKMEKDNEVAEKAVEHLKNGRKKKKPYLRTLRDKLIEKSTGGTLATQEKQIKKIKP